MRGSSFKILVAAPAGGSHTSIRSHPSILNGVDERNPPTQTEVKNDNEGGADCGPGKQRQADGAAEFFTHTFILFR